MTFHHRPGLTALVVFALSTMLDPAAILAQSGAPTPKWDVASVKPRQPRPNDADCNRENSTPGSIVLPCYTLKGLIGIAYVRFADGKQNPGTDVPVEGGPSWLGADHWGIRAKADGPASPEMMRGPMLQQLLEDRFRLKLHRETRQIPVYSLVVTKGGMKVQPEKRVCAPPARGNRLGPNEMNCGTGLPHRE